MGSTKQDRLLISSFDKDPDSIPHLQFYSETGIWPEYMKDAKVYYWIGANAHSLSHEDFRRFKIEFQKISESQKHPVFLYGGDPLPKEKGHINIATLMKVAKTEFNIPVFAVQCREYAAAMFEETLPKDVRRDTKDLVPQRTSLYVCSFSDAYKDMLTGAFVYSAEFEIDEQGKKRILFGGYNPKTNSPVGATSVVCWLEHAFNWDLVNIHNAGGGHIAGKELIFFYNRRGQNFTPLHEIHSYRVNLQTDTKTLMDEAQQKQALLRNHCVCEYKHGLACMMLREEVAARPLMIYDTPIDVKSNVQQAVYSLPIVFAVISFVVLLIFA